MRLEPTFTRLSRFLLSALTVAFVHWAAIAWALQEPPISDEESQAGGAFIIELSTITASPNEERRDISVGVKAEEVAAVAASTPQQASVAASKPEENEPIVPVTTLPPPEDALVKPPEEKPLEEVEPVEAAQAKDAPAVVAVDASEAAAPQQIENAEKVSETPAGQFQGLSRFDRAAIENWRRDVAVYLNKFKRYPLHAREARASGVVNVSFAMDRTGRVLRAEVVRGSGFDILDAAAIELVNKASPLPAPPETKTGDTIELIVPVKFRWRD